MAEFNTASKCTYRASRLRAGLVCVMALLMTVASIAIALGWLAGKAPGMLEQIAGWIGVAFFGLASVVFLYILVVAPVVLRIDEEGLWHSIGIYSFRLRWDQVSSMALTKASSLAPRMVLILLRDPGAYYSDKSIVDKIMHSSSRLFGFGDLYIYFNTVAANPNDVFDELMSWGNADGQSATE